MSETKLKPCPLCGGEIHNQISPRKDTIIFMCKKCGADICFYGAEHEPKATQAYNRRADDDD